MASAELIKSALIRSGGLALQLRILERLAVLSSAKDETAKVLEIGSQIEKVRYSLNVELDELIENELGIPPM
jgi:hypothetical protein